MAKQQNSSASVHPNPELMRDSDIRALRELIGGNTNLTSFLLGSSLIAYKMSSEKGGDQPISDPRMAILVRLLTKYPDERYFPLPVMPTYEQFSRTLKENWLPERLSTTGRLPQATPGVIGPLMGVNSSACYNWERGGNYDSVISRLFWVVSNMINLEGESGFAKYINVVEEEAKSRGKDLKDIIKARSWGRKDRATRPGGRRRTVAAAKKSDG